MIDLGAENFARLLRARVPILDVRAPIEFRAGKIPGSINLPILSDDERHRVGLAYKTEGPDAAVSLGHRLVSADVRNRRVDAWVTALKANPDAVLTCFRGGLRSQTAQSWLREVGLDRPLLRGGYKAFRGFLLAQLERLKAEPIVWIGGATGAGKSVVLNEVARFRPTLDLEKHAHHRGSAFGALDEAQPTQIDFENELAAEMIRQESDERGWVLEDEGIMVGRVAIPNALVQRKREAPLVVVEENLASRIDHTYEVYVGALSQGALERAGARYREALDRIARRLGGLRHREIAQDLNAALVASQNDGPREAHRIWIEKLLAWYYDPLYLGDLARRQAQVVFRGPRAEVVSYLQAHI